MVSDDSLDEYMERWRKGVSNRTGRGKGVEEVLLCEVIRSHCNKQRWRQAQLWLGVLSLSNLDLIQIGI